MKHQKRFVEQLTIFWGQYIRTANKLTQKSVVKNRVAQCTEHWVRGNREVIVEPIKEYSNTTSFPCLFIQYYLLMGCRIHAIYS